MRALLHRRRGSGDQFSLASFRGIVRRWQTDRQVVKTQNWPNLGTVSFVGRWRVLQVPQVLRWCTLTMLCAVCCVLCTVLLCCCCRLCCWWCWWESQGRRVERLTTSCLHRHQPDHCHHRRHRLVTVFRSRPKRAKQNRHV